MNKDIDLTIEELEAISGQTRRNIRYLISQGIVPEPIGRSRWSKYGPEHVRALAIYSENKSIGITSLDIIRERVSMPASDPPLIIRSIPGVEIKIDKSAYQDVHQLIELITKEIKSSYKLGDNNAI